MGSDDCRQKDANQWLIQAGITKNWFGFGNTAIFGEYSKNNDWGAANGAGRNFMLPPPGAVAVNGVTDTEMTVWGIGITQNIDAAATELYLNYRHFSADSLLPVALGAWVASCRPRTSTRSSVAPA